MFMRVTHGSGSRIEIICDCCKKLLQTKVLRINDRVHINITVNFIILLTYFMDRWTSSGGWRWTSRRPSRTARSRITGNVVPGPPTRSTWPASGASSRRWTAVRPAANLLHTQYISHAIYLTLNPVVASACLPGCQPDLYIHLKASIYNCE